MSGRGHSSFSGGADSVPGSACCSYAFGDFSVEVQTRQLRRGSSVIPLPARAFDALAYLIAHHERAVDKNELIEAVWRGVAVTDDSLIHAISVLRRALHDDPSRPSLIETLPKLGYRFIGTVEVCGAEPVAADADVSRQQHMPPQPSEFVVPARRRILFATSASLLILLAASIWLVRDNKGRRRVEEAVRTPVQLEVLAPAGTSLASGGVVSPTGSHLAFVARDKDGTSALWVRALWSQEPQKLPGTAGASQPFWSPDGRFIGFFGNGQILAIGLTGDAPRSIARIGGMTPAGGSWGSTNQILFADWTAGILMVPAAGGSVRKLARIEQSALDIAHAWPEFLPDGRHFVYQLMSVDAARAGVWVGSVDSPTSFRLLDAASPAAYVPPGFLLYLRHDLLMAEAFDPSRLRLGGRPMVLAKGVTVPPVSEGFVVSGSRDVIAFREGVTQPRLTIVDRQGIERDAIDVSAPLFNFRVSRQQQLLATSSPTPENSGLWLVDLRRRQDMRLRNDGIGPIWAPDGFHLAFTARAGMAVYIRSTTGEGSAKVVIDDGATKVLNDWSSDGRSIIYTQLDPETKLDLWQLQVNGGSPRPLLRTRFNESQARISPDSRFVAYTSDETGVEEVYVRSYPDLERPQKVSMSGGAQPQWRADQAELFYLSADRVMMSIPVDLSHGATFGPPRRLFQTTIPDNASVRRDSYVATANGQLFVLDGSRSTREPSRIAVVVNWAEGASSSPKFASTRDAPVTQLTIAP